MTHFATCARCSRTKFPPQYARSAGFDDLPSGEYYLAALTEADSDEWQAASFLSEVVPAAIKVTIGDGEKKVQDLRIGR